MISRNPLSRAPSSTVSSTEPVLGSSLDRCADALEIEPGSQLTLGLIDRILHLHAVDFGDNVKGWHKSKPSQPFSMRSVGEHVVLIDSA